MKLRKKDNITFVGSAVVVFLCTNAVAQEGHEASGSVWQIRCVLLVVATSGDGAGVLSSSVKTASA